MKRLALVSCLLVPAGVVFLVLVSKEDERVPSKSARSSPPEVASVRSADLLPDAPPEAEGGTALLAEAPPARTPSERAPLAGILRAGGTAGEALLTWTALAPELEGVRTPGAIDYERLRGATVATTSDAGGAFCFPAVPAGARAEPSVVWITCPDREPRSVALDAGANGWSWSEVAATPERVPLRVRVERGGEPVAGATVRHLLSFWEPGQTEAEQRLRRVFVREARTGADGTLALVPGAGENSLVAWAGTGGTPDELAIAWFGTPEKEPIEEVVLELLPTIEVSGRVLVDEPTFALDGARYYVGFLDAADGSDLVWGGNSRGVRSDGSFGPDRWPRVARRRLRAQVVGGGIVPAGIDVDNPAAGAGVTLELRTSRGLPFEVAVATPEGRPIQGALLDAWHWSGSDWLQLSRETTGEDGRAALSSPAGELTLEVLKPGFSSRSIQDVERLLVPQLAPPLRLVLRPAGVVTGFVHSGIEPVRRFAIFAWNEDRSYQPTARFEDEEGAFRLEDVPRGETVYLFAYSDELPQSETRTLVLGDESLELEFELPEPCKAAGRVIDALTREPVPGAKIQHLLTGMGGMADYRGAQMSVEPDGRFQLDGFCPGRGGFSCIAEGYEELFYSTREDVSEVIDVGLLALNPLALLEVEVRESGVSDFSAYRAWNRSNSDRTPCPLASDGTLSIPSRTGYYQLHVTRPDGSVFREDGDLAPGEHKRVRMDLSGGVELVATLEEPPSDIASWSLSAFTRGREAEHQAKARWSEESRAFVLGSLFPGDTVLELRDAEGGVVLQRRAHLADAPHQSLALRLGGERHRLRLVDGRGRPWATRPVTVTLGDASGWFALLDTDAQGELEIGPLEARRVVLSAKLANESLAYGLEVELEPDPARTTLVVVDAGPRSILRLIELGRPVAGIRMTYSHELGPRQLDFGYISDVDGLVRGPFLGPGTYALRPDHRDFWPLRLQATQSASEEPRVIELYQRGALAIEVTTLAGRPIGGARLELRHRELGESAEDWLAAGKLAAPNGLSTDASGRLVLEGVPRGTYAWSCTTPGGNQRIGTASLAPGERETLPIRLEEAGPGR